MISHYMYPHAYRPKAERFSDFKPLATALFKRWGMNKVDIYEQGEDDNIQYAVMSNDDVVIVAFRGSDNMLGKDGWADWVATDTRLLQKEITSWGKAEYQNKRGVTVTEGPGVHKGFYYAYRDVRHNINSRIKAHGGDKKKLFITGHSLGAALATLCAIDQGYSSEWIMPGRDTKQYRAQAVYTYGSPRVGNGLFRKLYNSKKSAGGTAALNTHRYVNRADGICMGPPDSYAFDLACQIYDWLTPHDVKKYTHVGRTCNITSSKIARDDDEYRGTGDMKYHDSKAYCDQIYRFHIKPRSWAKEMPLPPCHGSEGIFSN
ncbi:MAG: hypothetical protein DHS20C21_23470 [Gemmatimonadota bacterium]|nr:MAG: hypothetical protein DHS20C21_23470 [Gemmatimonadota bacterium]